MFRYLLLLLGVAIMVANPASACDSGENCIEENAWQFGVAIGVGARTNPLVDGDTIPLVLLPDIAWYGESAYFDNGELGYQWQVSEAVNTELYIAPNLEKAFFTFWHPANILVTPTSALSSPDAPSIPGSGDNNGEGIEPREISIDDIDDRDWSADIGFRTTWRHKQQSVALTLANDALGVHNGHQVTLAYQYGWLIDDVTISATASLAYKSASLVDYYYGIDAADTPDNELWYRASQSWQPSIGVRFSAPLSADWTLLGRFQYTALDSAMKDSPLVSESHVITAFFGVGYRF